MFYEIIYMNILVDIYVSYTMIIIILQMLARIGGGGLEKAATGVQAALPCKHPK
jgi:hypothetical protein